MEITERQKEILCQIIEEYAETASPVGSVTLAKLFGVSSATIRTEMARLEALGLIAQPHTSAGRVPTDAGYRFYVNSLNGMLEENWGREGVAEGHEGWQGQATGEAPAKEAREEVRKTGAGTENDWRGKPAAEGDKTAKGARGELRKTGVEAENGLSLAERGQEELNRWIRRGVHALEVRVAAQSRADAAIRGAVDALVELTGNLGLATIGDQLYLAGISRLFTQPEFLDTRRVQAVAKLLDNLEPWLREAAPGEPLNIFIGHENPIGKNSDVSLIISKFRSPFSDRSYIGTLGPTRQNYFKIMSLVKYAGNMLEEVL